MINYEYTKDYPVVSFVTDMASTHLEMQHYRSDLGHNEISLVIKTEGTDQGILIEGDALLELKKFFEVI